ncbi:MAG: prolyl oligopeptidase family serine peptidase [Chthonomonas sp.]|nr:prolyl oligopeptidase family serine peptidase [Chthonomonas sp.]
MILPLLADVTPDFGLKIEAILARQIPPRTRSLIRVDPVEYEVITDTLKPEKPWESRAVDGWKVAPGGYVWYRVSSPKKQILQLNVSGASMAYVNGEPRVGDVYAYGTYFVPVVMEEGVNDILLYGFRGDAMLNWRKPEAEIELDRFDATLPDFRTETNSAQGYWGGFVVRNNSDRPRTVSLHSERVLEPAKQKLGTVTRLIPPLGTIKVPVAIPNASDFNVVLGEGEETWANKTFKLQVRTGGEPYRRTFMSQMDGSIQYYAINPSSKPNPRVAVLSLHGASVEAIGQAQAYGQKDFCDIICPTNRRPFGFNWEGIGRRDAIEVLKDATGKANYDRDRIMLTGHSMGGHGAWHLGSHYPNIFAAVGPCAGWISFDTYAGGANYDLENPVQKLLARGNNSSNPLLLKENFALYKSVYIHHGGADETVPVTEARRMRDELNGLAKVDYNEVPGGGHWFDNDPAPGADSVDWKPMFDVFRTARKTDPVAARKIDFRTMDVDINASFGLGNVLAQTVPFELTRIQASLDSKGWSVTTTNASRLWINRTGPIALDGKTLIVKYGDVLTKSDDGWAIEGFDHTSRHGMTAAYSQYVLWAGPWNSPIAEEAGLWRLVRYHLEQLWYRANATPRLVSIEEARRSPFNFWNYTFIDANDDRATFSSELGDVGPSRRMQVIMSGYSKKGVRLMERFPLLSPGIPYPDWFATNIGLLQGKAKHTQAGYYAPSGNKFETLVSSDSFPN